MLSSSLAALLNLCARTWTRVKRCKKNALPARSLGWMIQTKLYVAKKPLHEKNKDDSTFKKCGTRLKLLKCALVLLGNLFQILKAYAHHDNNDGEECNCYWSMRLGWRCVHFCGFRTARVHLNRRCARLVQANVESNVRDRYAANALILGIFLHCKDGAVARVNCRFTILLQALISRNYKGACGLVTLCVVVVISPWECQNDWKKAEKDGNNEFSSHCAHCESTILGSEEFEHG